MKNLILVDVDGVLNPSTPSENHKTYTIGLFKVYLNPVHGSWLIDLADRTDSELVWCTMWEENAPIKIAPKVGLPEMPFIPISRFKMSSSFGADKAYSAKKYADGRKFVAFEDEWDFQHHLYGSNGHQVIVDYTTGLQKSHISQAEHYLLG
jgi:hypothetical protein